MIDSMKSYDFFQTYEQQYNKIPVMKVLYGDDITPIGVVKKLEKEEKLFYLFESKEDKENTGRYSYIGFQPKRIIRGYDRGVEIETLKGIELIDMEAQAGLKLFVSEYKMPRIQNYPQFVGGYVGYFSFESFGLYEKKLYESDDTYPFYELMEFDKTIVFDHLTQRIMLVATYESKDGSYGYKKALEQIELLQGFVKVGESITLDGSVKMKQEPKREFISNVSKEEFKGCVEKVKNYIKEGDIFQAVISRRFEMEYEHSLIAPYRVMRIKNPSPYMYYIKTPTLEIAGTSPETLVKLNNRNITTYPIAGTRPRGKTVEEDNQLEIELLKDEKELSEHNMLVDLARNDVGKISEIASVFVPEYMNIHRFSKVMHIASTVTGTLKSSYDCIDTIGTILPAGTLSGAPKIRAVNIIKEIEKIPRGVYGGGIGYISYTGDMDICIGIRTAIKKGNKVYVQAGCGVVMDSNWENEYEETENKASAIKEAFYKAWEVE